MLVVEPLTVTKLGNENREDDEHWHLKTFGWVTNTKLDHFKHDV